MEKKKLSLLHTSQTFLSEQTSVKLFGKKKLYCTFKLVQATTLDSTHLMYSLILHNSEYTTQANS